MKSLVIAAIALVGLTAPALAGQRVYCDERTIAGYGGNPGATGSGTVFYGDVSNITVPSAFPSLSTPGTSTVMDRDEYRKGEKEYYWWNGRLYSYIDWGPWKDEPSRHCD
jgi:hypothetical protein